jgi:non-lysosomal glucosylceramidase
MGKSGRRSFLKTVGTGAAAAASASGLVQIGGAAAPAAPESTSTSPTTAGSSQPAKPIPVAFPRVFTGRRLGMLAFPLGGVAAGSLSLGGRGQLRDWEIYNRPDKGNAPAYAFPSIWVKADGSAVKPVVRVLESRFLPPYEGPNGLGSNNAPGLPRLASATFTGEYPLAHIDFRDARVPVRVSLDAFSPFIPVDAEDSGLPVAILRYTVTNPSSVSQRVSIAYSIENPVGSPTRAGARGPAVDSRVNEVRDTAALNGLLMSNPGLEQQDPLRGEFVLSALNVPGTAVSTLRGWPRGRWWNSPMLFWDDFKEDGELGPEAEARNMVGALCLSRSIPAGGKAAFTFVLAWRFPNRTPRHCGWSAPKGDEDTIIGNHYSERFSGAWEAAEYAAAHLERLEKYTRRFAAAMRDTTLPAAVKEAASANLSTLATTTCFRTADGEFHGFEGVNDKAGCCYGNCTHVWNYETATNMLFPSLARSLRKAAFGYSLDDEGAIHFRQRLPDGKERSGFAAADGQMGQIVKAYHDWKLSGDNAWLRVMWPRVKKALEFAWVPGGWDADRDGVMEGAQHNTYDVEFYGPNPQCGIYYLAGLRAGKRWLARWEMRPPASTGSCLNRGGRGLTATCSMGSSTCSRCAGFRRARWPNLCGVRWGPTTRRTRSTRWAAAAWWISWWDSIWQMLWVWGRWWIRRRRGRRWNRSTATTTSANSRSTTRCSGSSR